MKQFGHGFHAEQLGAYQRSDVKPQRNSFSHIVKSEWGLIATKDVFTSFLFLFLVMCHQMRIRLYEGCRTNARKLYTHTAVQIGFDIRCK